LANKYDYDDDSQYIHSGPKVIKPLY